MPELVLTNEVVVQHSMPHVFGLHAGSAACRGSLAAWMPGVCAN